jgi:ABC-type branched-subunit amino acid transport system ATPase component
MGISQSPEGRRLFPHTSVLENLEMGAFQRNDRVADGAKSLRENEQVRKTYLGEV